MTDMGEQSSTPRAGCASRQNRPDTPALVPLIQGTICARASLSSGLALVKKSTKPPAKSAPPAMKPIAAEVR